MTKGRQKKREKNFFLRKSFLPKKTLYSVGSMGTELSPQFAGNVAHQLLGVGFSKTCQFAKRFNCLLISMEQLEA
jgi:hypothetical protein